MAARKTGLDLPLPLQFLAAWLAVWLGRVLQEQVDYLKAENRRSPNLNALAERFVLSIKSECLDRLVPLGEAHLRRAILEYTKHHHEERNHQGLDNELIVPAKAASGVGKVDRRERLGGLLSFYYRKAA
jgi:transposase InsO family protein